MAEQTPPRPAEQDETQLRSSDDADMYKIPDSLEGGGWFRSHAPLSLSPSPVPAALALSAHSDVVIHPVAHAGPTQVDPMPDTQAMPEYALE